ncbi:unnamed protein product [Closterium sp. NIES-54]
MYGGGRGEGKHMLPSQQGYRTRDILFLLGTLGIAGTIATVVTATTVIGGGGFLFLISPLLLLFSPILVPLAIFGTVVGGGALFMATMTAMGVGSLVWFINYMRGKKPIGAESLDYVAGGVKGATDQRPSVHMSSSSWKRPGVSGAVAVAALAALLVLLYCLSLFAGVPLLWFGSAGCAQQRSDILLARTDADVRSSASTAGLFAELGRCEAQLTRLLSAAKARAEGSAEGEAAGGRAEPADASRPRSRRGASRVQPSRSCRIIPSSDRPARLSLCSDSSGHAALLQLHPPQAVPGRLAAGAGVVLQRMMFEKACHPLTPPSTNLLFPPFPRFPPSPQYNPPAADASSPAATGPHAYRCTATAADMRRFFNFTPRGPCPDDWLLVQLALQAAEKALSQFNPPAAVAASEAATGPHAYRCAATAADMRRFFNFTPRGPCPDDWLLVQRLVFDKACHALPRRRCTAATVDAAREVRREGGREWVVRGDMETATCGGSSTSATPFPHPPSKLPSIPPIQPMPVPEALFTQKALLDGNVRWQQHRCHSFSCLNRQSATDCRNCFNMTHEAHRWQRPYKGSIAMQDVIAMKPKSLR